MVLGIDKIIEVAYHVESDSVPNYDESIKVKSLDPPYKSFYITPHSVIKLHDNVYVVRYLHSNYTVYVNDHKLCTT